MKGGLLSKTVLADFDLRGSPKRVRSAAVCLFLKGKKGRTHAKDQFEVAHHPGWYPGPRARVNRPIQGPRRLRPCRGDKPQEDDVTLMVARLLTVGAEADA